MMFVTDLTEFAKNKFFPSQEAIYRCMCNVKFSIEIALKQTFHVKCDECGQIGVVKAGDHDYVTKAFRLQLEPIFVLEGRDLTEAT